MRSSFYLLVLGSCLLLSSTAKSEAGSVPTADVASARRFFDQGIEHFRLGEFDAAVSDFEAAFRTKPHPSVLFNLGRAYAAAGRPIEAVRALERYLAEEAVSLPAHSHRSVAELLAAQRRRLGALTVTTTDPGITVSVDGIVVGETPLATAISLAPGNHAVVGTRDGFLPRVVALQIDPSETRELALKLEAVPIAAPVVATRPLRSPPLEQRKAAVQPNRAAPARPLLPATQSHVLARIGTVALGVGIASAAVGSYFAVRAQSSWNEREQHCARGVCDDQAVEAWKDAKRFALGADVSLALGVVAAGAGLYLLLAPSSEAQKPSTTRLSVGSGGNSWFVQLGGSL